jgi:multiple sugar transport system permease protein
MEVLGFIGLGNYINIINDSAFRVSFLNSLILGFAGALPAVLVALLVASVSNQQFRGSGIILSLIVAAWAIPPIVAGRVWRIFFLPNGLISTLGSYLGLCERSYSILGDPSFALISVIIASIWKFSPFATLILFGGMRTIPPELYEAAKIDGATFYRTFRHITLPLIARYFSIAVLFVGMYMAATVDLVYALTGGGPGYATEILASYTYKVYFLQQDFGKGGATSIILIMWSLISVGPLIYFISKQMFGRE